MAPAASKPTARTKILGSALAVLRGKGYAATSVDDLCAAAGVTKGAFFHHFKSKEDLAVAAADYWSETTAAFFASAPYHAPRRPAAAPARLHRFPQGDPHRRHPRVHLPRRHHGAGDVRDQSLPSAMRVPAPSSSMPKRSRPTSPRQSAARAVYARRGAPRASRCTPRRCCRAPSSSPRPKAARRSPPKVVDHLRRYVELLFEQPKHQEEAA